MQDPPAIGCSPDAESARSQVSRPEARGVVTFAMNTAGARSGSWANVSDEMLPTCRRSSMRLDMCPLCTGTNVRDSHRAPCGLALEECLDCGHVFQRWHVTQLGNEEMQLQYFGEQFAQRRGTFFNLYEAINARRTLRRLRCDGRKRVLEIGPGSGTIMGGLARLGHKAEGLDLSPAVAKIIKQRWGLTVHIESLDVHEEKQGPGCYDMIIMRHVLEHFHHLDQALGKVHSLLKPEGLLYVAVPNMGSWHSRFNGWRGYQPYHIHYFNRRSLTWALTKSNFLVTHLHTYESLTGWPNTIGHSLSIESAGSLAASITYTPGLKRHLLELARLAAGISLSPLRLFQSLIGQGEELTVVAEKVAS